MPFMNRWVRDLLERSLTTRVSSWKLSSAELGDETVQRFWLALGLGDAERLLREEATLVLPPTSLSGRGMTPASSGAREAFRYTHPSIRAREASASFPT